jgi:outer membrane immunogenic protein
LLPHESLSTESGFAGGVQGGYNWQFRCTLFGVEADYTWMARRQDRFWTAGSLPASPSFAEFHRNEQFGTVRARTGVIVDNLLLYVTGGLAYANFDRNFTLTVPGVFSENFEHRKTRLGWTFGVGTEWAIWDNWSVKSEVLYARFERHENQFFSPFYGTNFRFDHEDQVWVTRIGLNYRFGGLGGYGPVVAKY